MDTLDVCEDYFSYICDLLRSSEIGEVQYYKLRHEILALLDKTESNAFESKLGEQWQNIKLTLIFFTDSIISASTLSCAAEWSGNRLAYTLEPPEYAGDEKFFDNLIAVWEHKQSTSDELLAVYYTCLALGFRGQAPLKRLQAVFNRNFEAMHEEEVLENLIKILKPRIDHLIIEPTVNVIQANKLFINKTDLRTPASSAIFIVSMFALGLVLLLVLVNNLLFHNYTTELMKALELITK